MAPKSKTAARKAKLERKLEEGLRETFPGSDPVAITEPGPKERGPRKKVAKTKRR